MEEEEKNTLNPYQEVFNTPFGRSLHSHMQEVYPEVFNVLSDNDELLGELLLFTKHFKKKYLEYMSNNPDHQFAFNESYDETISLMQSQYNNTSSNLALNIKNEKENEDTLSSFDLDKNGYVDSDELN